MFICLFGTAYADGPESETRPNFNFDSTRQSVWAGEVGDGFVKHAKEVGVDAGLGFGLRVFGGRKYHDLALGDVHAGVMLSGPVGGDHWYRGNFELLGNLFGGGQYNDHTAFVVGVAPLIRYNFATGCKLVPFVGGGGGPSFTDIKRPDLSTQFEFNVQLQSGVHWFIKPNMAVTGEFRWLHLSNAGISHPNQGVNTSLFLVGANWFF